MEQKISFYIQLKVHLIILILVLVPEGASLFLDQHQDNTTALFSHKLLSTPFCNRQNLDMSDTCPSPFELNLLIEKCGFECPPDEKPDCVNTQQGGSAYVCLPRNLTCDKGIRRIGWIDKTFENLIVREERCPTGTFQAYRSDCFQACTAIHVQLKTIPRTFLVFSEGDSTSPTYVYCNYLEGYFNTKNKTLLNYDQEGMHNPYFCQHVNFSNPCENGKEVLGNGTCVLPCAPGMCRDDHDNFICKFNCSAGDSTNVKVTTIPVTTQHNDVKTITSQAKEENSKEKNGSRVEEEKPEEENNKADDRIVVSVATSGGAVFLLVLIGIICLMKFIRSQKKERTPQTNNENKKLSGFRLGTDKASIPEPGGLNVHDKTESSGPRKVTSVKKYENGRTIINAYGNVSYYAGSKGSAEQKEIDIETADVETTKLMQLKMPDEEEKAETEETAVKMLDDE